MAGGGGRRGDEYIVGGEVRGTTTPGAAIEGEFDGEEGIEEGRCMTRRV